MSTVEPKPQGEAPTGPSPVRPTPRRTGRGDRQLLRFALLGTFAVLLFVTFQVQRNGAGNPVSLVQPATQGPSSQVFHQDFPHLEMPDGLGLDGQMYYAMARDPFHLDHTAHQLDRPRYRFQRPLMSWLAWGLHPSGGGQGLVLALAAVGAAGLFLLAYASGSVSRALGGPAWVAALVPLAPGAYWSMRVSVSDALALGLVLAAIALSARNRTMAAVVVGALAVLAKEPAILLLLGWALWRRDRAGAALVAIPGAVIVAWMGWLHVALPTDPQGASDLGLPFAGVVHAWTDIWSSGHELVGMACTLGGLVLGGAALAIRRLRHPLGWALAIQLAFLACLGSNPAGINFGATRMAMPAMALAVIALATPEAAARLAERRGPQAATQSVPEVATTATAGTSARRDGPDHRNRLTPAPEHALTGRSGPGVGSGARSKR